MAVPLQSNSQPNRYLVSITNNYKQLRRMKQLFLCMQVCIVSLTVLLASCSSELETPMANHSDGQDITIGSEVDYGLEDEWEAYFASLDSLDAEFGIYNPGIAVMNNDTAKDRNSKLHAVVFADAMGAIEGWVESKSWQGAVFSGVMASLEQIASLQVALNVSTVRTPIGQPIVGSDWQLRADSIAQVQFDSIIALKEATSVGLVHNKIIRTMAQEKFPLLRSTHTEIANEVLRQYCLITKDSITDELLNIASKEKYYDIDAYLRLSPRIRLANKRYMDSAKQLSGTKLYDFTNSYIRNTRQTISLRAVADPINTFADVAYSSKIMWNIKDE